MKTISESYQRLKFNCLAAGISAALTLASPSALSATKKMEVDIQPQRTDTALMQLAEDIGIQIMFPPEIAKQTQSNAVKGNLAPEDAIKALLATTDLEYKFISDNTVTVSLKQNTENSSEIPRIEDKIRNRELEEIIVTATKRESRLQDLGFSISAIGAEQIEKRNLVQMDDYLRTTAGANMIKMADGRQKVIMRGITAGPQFEKNSVGIYFGEMPTTGIMDTRMVDIDRVEILRGPHGTLYGSGTMTGAVRIIPAAPVLNEFEGKISAELSNTSARGSINNSIDAMLNIPLIEDKLAARVVAYSSDMSGFIDNRAADIKGYLSESIGAMTNNTDDIGQASTQGARLSVLFQPTEALSFNLSHLSEKNDEKGRAGANPELGKYLQARFTTEMGDERFESDISYTNLVAKYDLGWGELLSSSTWRTEEVFSVRNFLGVFWEPIPISQGGPGKDEAFIQEVRLNSSFDGPLQFLVGVYYEDIKTDGGTDYRWNAADGADNPFNLGDPNGFGTKGGVLAFQSSTRQKAFFGELSYDVTDDLTVTVGTRRFSYDLTSDGQTVIPGFFYPTTDSYFVDLASSESEDSYKFNATYKLTDESLVYIQWAEGFRLGSPLNPTSSTCDVDGDGNHDDLGLPFLNRLNSDFTENTEIGTKFSMLDGKLNVNASIYSIDWNGIPVYIGISSPCGHGINVNAGSANSRGAEVELTYYASDAINIDFSTSYINAELGVDVEGLGVAGSRLPGMPKANARLGVQYQFALAGYDSYLRTDMSYVGGFYNNLEELGDQAGNYVELNVKLGTTVDNINMALFINNLTNADSYNWVDQFPPTVSYLRPRTFGLKMGYNF